MSFILWSKILIRVGVNVANQRVRHVNRYKWNKWQAKTEHKVMRKWAPRSQVEYTNGEKTGLNKYETKVSWNITMRSLEVQNGVWKGWRWNRLWHLLTICQTSLWLGHHPATWKIFTTVTLWKSGKLDYSIPKDYRSIVLENILSKILESMMARRLSFLAEKFDPLPENHFRGWQGQMATDTILLLTQHIKDAWQSHKVASVVYLDIIQAFPTVNHQ